MREWPARRLIGLEEKAAVDALFDQAIADGEAFGYGGPSEDTFCKEFAEFLGGGYADAVNAGTTAVYVALRSLNLEPFTEVIVPPISDPGGIMPVPLLNLIPVVADCAPGRYNIGPEQIEAVISPYTSAILVAHIAGEPADMEGIMAVAKKHNLPVVEDCAQAHGAKLNGKLVGTFGSVGAFSTMFGKHICTGGQGGVVFTKDEEHYQFVRRCSDRGKPFFMPAGSTNCFATLNFNSDDLACTIGSVQLKRLPGMVESRRRSAAAIFAGLDKLKSVSRPDEPAGAECSYWFLRLKFNKDAVGCDKATFVNTLADEGFPVAPDYNSMPYRQEWFTKRNVLGTSGYPWASPLYKGDPNREFPCPNAVKAIEDHLFVYFHENWTDEDVQALLEGFARMEAKHSI
jgi:dTDP-4-amino-4,6-dideoxygalactose transaminase